MTEAAEDGKARAPASRLLWPLFALKLGVALWAVDRGFELGDEGYFLLNLRHPDGAPPPFEFYRWIAALGGLPLGVVGGRLLRIAVELVASVALAAGVFAWARARVFAAPVRFAPFLAFCLLGALLSAASRGFGYNDATNLCVYAAAACLFALAARPHGQRALLAAAGAGCFAALQLFVKFPPGIVVAALFALAIVAVLDAGSLRARLRYAAVYALGAAFGAIAVIAPTGGFAPLAERLAIARQLPALTGYDPLAILVRSVALEIWTFVDVAVLALGFGAAYALRRRVPGVSRDAVFARALAVGAALLFAVVLPLHPTFVHWTLVYLGCLLVFLPLALLWLARGAAPERAPARSAEIASLLLLLIALPFVQALGTNVPLIVRLPSHGLPFFAALAVLVFDLRERFGLVRFERRLAAILAAVTALAFAHHHVFAPYGLPRPMHEQVVAVPSLPGLRVDAASASFLDAVATSMAQAGYRPGDPVLALDYMPGLVVLLGGSSPGSNLYMFDKPLLNCFQLNRVRFERPPWLILGEPMLIDQQACMESVAFPRDFRSVRSIANPYERVYETFGRPGFSHVLLFGPR